MKYSVCVMEMETYDNIIADNEDDAKIQAVDYFRDDDMYFGSDEAESCTVDDCEIVWEEEE